jgi:PAS domain S-box-containing protein
MRGRKSDQSIMRMLRLSGTAAIVGFCLIGMALLAYEVSARLDALERANSDNTQWVMMQAEVEVLRLQTAVLEATKDSTSATDTRLDTVRRWFDVLYSRVSMLEQSPVYAPLIRRPEYTQQHAMLRAFLDGLVPVIDGPDQGLAKSLPQLEAALPDIRAAARTMTLNALSEFAAQSDMQRNSISDTLVRLAVLTGMLIFVMGGLSFVLSRMQRKSEQQTEEVRETGVRLSTIVEHSADAIVVTNRAGDIVEFNPAAQAIFGLERDKALGKKALNLLSADDDDGAQRTQLVSAFVREFVPGGGPLRLEMDARRADGSHFPAELSIAVSGPGNDGLVVAFARDISDRRQAQRELTDARDHALAGEKAKAEFLAVMSHEMRTPLNGLIGSMDLLGDTDLDPVQRHLLNVMMTSGGMLLSHVNAVLDVSRAEVGAMRLVDTAFDLDRLVAEAVANQAGLAAAGGNVIAIEQVGGPIGLVRGDPGRVQQTVLNLIGNAVKFTRKGRITVETERLSAAEAPNGCEAVEVRVIDTGIGIPEDQIDRIFEDFVTLDTGYDRINGGTGLGLGIVKRLVQAMGGEIGAESVEGEGSVFWLRLPLPVAKAQTAPDRVRPTDAPPTAPLSVLVVEDNEINRFLLRRTLEVAGHQVTEATDGQDGVALAEATSFDVILMDISMPRLDGIEATRRIRGGVGKSAQSRIIALTAHALPAEVDRFLAAGMEVCLTKPVSRAMLLAALAGPVAATSGPTPDAGVDQVLDRTSLQQLVGQIGPIASASLLVRLIDEGDATIATVMQLDRAQAADEIRRVCHHLAGTCGAFGTRRLHVVLARIEQSVIDGDSAAMSAELSALPALWADTRAALQSEATSLATAA